MLSWAKTKDDGPTLCRIAHLVWHGVP